MRSDKMILMTMLSIGLVMALVTGCTTALPPSVVYVEKPSPPTPPPLPPPPPAPTATANVREIIRVTHDPAPKFAPRSSPDGTLLLFYTFDATKPDAKSGFSVVLIEIGKTGRKLIAGPYAKTPAWYPNGKQFVYVYMKASKPILVRNPVSGAGMTFINPSSMGDDDNEPHVSPDGKRIVFQTKIGGVYSICTVDMDGANFTVYTEGSSPRWYPDGSKISFDKKVGEHSQCFVLDINTGQVTQLTMGENTNAFPVWSPDGKLIAFVSDRDGKMHLYYMRPDGSEVTQLTKGESQESFPEWSSDGYIYFCSDAGSPKAMSARAYKWTYSDIWRLKPVLGVK